MLATGSDPNEDDTAVEIILDAMADWFQKSIKNKPVRWIAISIVSVAGIFLAYAEWVKQANAS